MRRLLSAVVVLLATSPFASAAYILTNAAGTTVKYEAKESLTNSDSSNSIVRSLGTVSDPTLGVLTDATLSVFAGGSSAYVSPDTNPHGITNANNFITQGSATDSALDLTFTAAAGQGFSSGDFRVNTTLYGDAGATGLWPAGSNLRFQVSTDGGTTFTNIMRRDYPASLGREDSGVLSIPGISGATSIIIRGRITSTGGSTNGHWALISTQPFANNTFAGGLELNLTTFALPEPGTLSLLGLAIPILLRRRSSVGV